MKYDQIISTTVKYKTSLSWRNIESALNHGDMRVSKLRITRKGDDGQRERNGIKYEICPQHVPYKMDRFFQFH